MADPFPEPGARNDDLPRQSAPDPPAALASLRQVLGSAPVVLFALDLEGRFTFGEGGGLADLGLRPGEWHGRSVFDVYRGNGELLDAVRRALTGQEFTAISRIGARAFETRYTPLRDGDGSLIGTIGVALDVTRRENAIRAQHASQELLERQLHFEQRVAEVSRHLLALPGDSAREGLAYALESAAQIAGADRVFLVGRKSNPPHVAERYEWRAPHAAGDDDLTAERISGFRWWVERVERGEIVVVNDPADLPEEAASERRSLEARRVRSVLGVPVRSGADLIGYMSFESQRTPRTWSERQIFELQLVAGIFGSVLRRKRTEEALARRLDLEQRVADLSRRFVGLRGAEIAAGIEWGLAAAAEIADADLAYLIGIDGSARLGEKFEWRAPGIAGRVEDITDAYRTRFRWSADRFARGEIVELPNPGRPHADAAAERADLERRGVQSLLGIPVFERKALIGYLGFECFRRGGGWSEEDRTLLRLVAEIFASALRRKRAEEALHQSQAQLAQAQKMDAVGRLAGGIAHDFNNLLMVISGHGETLLRELGDGDPLARDVHEIGLAAERAAALTGQLLSFSRRKPVSPRRIDLSQVVSGIADMLRRLLGEHVQLTVEGTSDLWPVHADPHQLEQILVNLAVNARDAMPEGGRLRITTANRHVDETAAHGAGLRAAGDYVVLRVSDTGTGFDQDLAARIFEPFFTTKEQGKGTGLGLSIVYSAVQRSGGAVAVQSQPGRGATFEILVPRARGAVEPEVAERGDEVSPGSGTILLVEDEEAVRRLVRRELEAAGYAVLEASDGVHALEVATDSAAAIDLLVTDVVMPRMGGGLLAAALLAEHPDVGVLYLSGYPDERVAGSQELPPGEFLQKPFRMEELFAKLARLRP
jgi:signal transduction histidine kinase/CheY-like chemotaxis protein